MWVVGHSMVVIGQAMEVKKYGRVLTDSDFLSKDEPIRFNETSLYRFYKRNEYDIKNIHKFLWREFIYLIDDGISVVYNAYKIITRQHKPIVVYREVKTTRVKQKIAKPIVKVKDTKEQTNIDENLVIGEQKVVVNGQVLTRKIYKEKVDTAPKRSSRKQPKQKIIKRRNWTKKKK